MPIDPMEKLFGEFTKMLRHAEAYGGMEGVTVAFLLTRGEPESQTRYYQVAANAFHLECQLLSMIGEAVRAANHNNDPENEVKFRALLQAADEIFENNVAVPESPGLMKTQ